MKENLNDLLNQFRIIMPDWYMDACEKMGILPWDDGEEKKAEDPYVTSFPSNGYSSSREWGMK